MKLPINFNNYNKLVDTTITVSIGFIFITLAWLAFATSFALFTNLYFTSDGFHYYSAIRNFAFFQTTYEGPTFEYIIGNHGYFTMFLLSPIVRFFPTPYILAFTNVATHFLTAILLYYSGKKVITSDYKNAISAMVALMYVVFPLVVNGYFASVYMFQPDYILAPLLEALFLTLINGNIKIFILLECCIILTKEEYIPFIPIYLIFVVSYCFLLGYSCSILTLTGGRGGLSTHLIYKSSLMKILVVFTITSFLSILCIKLFRDMNLINHAVRSVNYSYLFSVNAYEKAFSFTFNVIKPIIPIALLAFFRCSLTSLSFLFFIIIFPLGRSLLNQVIYYGDPVGVPWSNVVIAPSIFISIIFLLGFMSTKLPKKTFSFASIILLLASLFLSIKTSSHNDSAIKINNYLINELKPQFNLLEIQKIKNRISPPFPQPAGKYFIMDEYLQGLLMNYSHVSSGFVINQNNELKNKIIEGAEFIFLNKNSIFTAHVNMAYFIKELETENFILFKKKISCK